MDEEEHVDWAKCSFCPRREPVDRMTRIGIEESSGPSAPLACKQCVTAMSEESLRELREMK
jgi:hypothetical protein